MIHVGGIRGSGGGGGGGPVAAEGVTVDGTGFCVSVSNVQELAALLNEVYYAGNGLYATQLAGGGFALTAANSAGGWGSIGQDEFGKYAAASVAASSDLPVLRSALEIPESGRAVGDIVLTTRTTPAADELAPDGSAVSRTTYAEYFALVGTTYGAGNGSTTFNLPNLPGRVPVISGSGSGLTSRTAGQTGGAESVTLSGAQSGLPAHSHTVPIGSSQNVGSHAFAGQSALGTVATSTSSAQDASQSHNNMQPFLVLNAFLKVVS